MPFLNVLANMTCTSSIIDMDDTVSKDTIEYYLPMLSEIRSTHHTVLGCTPGVVVFGLYMMFDIWYIAD